MESKLVIFITLFGLSLGANLVQDCGPSDAWFKFHKLDIQPMPFNVLGKIKVDFDTETTATIGESVMMSVNLKKSNLNNGFTWEIPCTNIGLIGGAANGITGYLGTCKYGGSCDFPFIKSWTSKDSCPSFFKDYNIPCTCPFPARRIQTKSSVEVDLSEFEDKMPKWLIEGGYKVEVEMTDKTSGKVVGCFKLGFTIDARKPCPEVLKKLNACP